MSSMNIGGIKVCNSLLGKGKDPPSPPGFMNQELADNFNDFPHQDHQHKI